MARLAERANHKILLHSQVDVVLKCFHLSYRWIRRIDFHRIMDRYLHRVWHIYFDPRLNNRSLNFWCMKILINRDCKKHHNHTAENHECEEIVMMALGFYPLFRGQTSFQRSGSHLLTKFFAALRFREFAQV